MKAASRRDRIAAQLADLKMPGALEALDEVFRRVDGGEYTAGEGIERLLGAQIELRNGRRLTAAMRSSRLPGLKTLAEFDFTFQPSIDRQQVESLHELGFLERKENVVILGPPGVGKTHIAISLAVAAAEAGRRIYFGTLAALVESLEEAHAAGRLKRRLKTLMHPALLVVDEIGYLPVTSNGARLFFQLVNGRYGRASTVLTSNKPYQQWGEVLHDEVMAAALLDRFFDRLEEVADTQTRLLDRTSEVAEVFESGMARLLEAKKAIREAGRSARVTMAAAQSLSQECRHLLGAQKKASDARVKAMERLESDLRNLTSHLTEKVEDYRSLSAQKIEEVFQLFDSEMAKITDHLSGTMDEMRDVAETLLRITQELPAAVKRLDHTTAEAVQTLDHAIKELARSETAQQESVTDGIRVFDQASARLSDGLEELAKVRAAFGTLPGLARTVHSSNERTAKAIEQLSAHLDSLATRAEKSGGRMLEKLAAVAERTGAASSQIESSIATSTDTAAPREARDRRPAGGGPEPDPEPDADDDSAREPDPRKGRRWRWPLWRRR